MDRTARLLGTADRTQNIIEIGAGYSPVAPKSGGWKAHVVDHASRDELKTKYAKADVDIEAVEVVDTIWFDGPLHKAVPQKLVGNVDLIIASHVLEHIPDLIGFLQSASQLVRPSGSISAALPDRRYCFDCFKPWTTTGDLLDAHERGLGRHSLKTAFNHIAYFALADGRLAWGPGPIKAPILLHPFVDVADTVASYRAQSDEAYQDYHSWQFTPAGFRLIMLEMQELGVSEWQVETMSELVGFEFFVTLHRVAGSPRMCSPVEIQRQRHGLLLAQLTEAREQIDSMLGPSASGMPASAPANYGDLFTKLMEQDQRLREIVETLAWLRAFLRPVRSIWRMIRKVGTNRLRGS